MAKEAKSSTPKKSNTWACNVSVTGWGFALEGTPVLKEQIEAMKKNGIDLSKHFA